MSYATRLNQRLQSNANQGFGYTNQNLGYANQGINYANQGINYENQGINYANNAIGKGNFYSNQGNAGLTQYDDNDLYGQSYQSMGYAYQPYNGVVNRQGFADYPDYSDISIVRAPEYGASSPCLDGGVNSLLGLLVVAGAAVGFYLTYTKLQSITKRGFNFNSVEHLLDMLWNG